MANMKTRFLDADVGGKPHVVKLQEARDEAEILEVTPLASLYYEQWIDREMWNEFEMNSDEARIYEDEKVSEELSEECF